MAGGQTVEKQFDRRIGEFLGADPAFRIVPSVGKVDDPEQDHGVDLLGPLDDFSFGVEPDQKIRDDVHELPLKVLDGLLLIFAEKWQIVDQNALFVGRFGVDLDNGANDVSK